MKYFIHQAATVLNCVI